MTASNTARRASQTAGPFLRDPDARLTAAMLDRALGAFDRAVRTVAHSGLQAAARTRIAHSAPAGTMAARHDVIEDDAMLAAVDRHLRPERYGAPRRRFRLLVLHGAGGQAGAGLAAQAFRTLGWPVALHEAKSPEAFARAWLEDARPFDAIGIDCDSLCAEIARSLVGIARAGRPGSADVPLIATWGTPSSGSLDIAPVRTGNGVFAPDAITPDLTVIDPRFAPGPLAALIVARAHPCGDVVSSRPRTGADAAALPDMRALTPQEASRAWP